MRFISPYSRYKLIIISQQTELMSSGQQRVIAPGFIAEFREGDVRMWEADYAREHLTFRGTVTEEGSERPIDPVPGRVGSYDTAHIQNEELRKEVEEKMLAHHDHGRDFYMVEKPARPAPWPTYDAMTGGGRGKTTAKVLAEQVMELGLNPEDVVLYERENQNRTEVIEALEALLVKEDAEEFISA